MITDEFLVRINLIFYKPNIKISLNVSIYLPKIAFSNYMLLQIFHNHLSHSFNVGQLREISKSFPGFLDRNGKVKKSLPVV